MECGAIREEDASGVVRAGCNGKLAGGEEF